ncbi:MAG: DNA gyrase C-terminal beta-propeller domain-containing protein, partial [Alphaproteobacteria bacterium]
RGMVYQLKCYKLPEAAPQALGKAMVNILPIEIDETINAIMPMPEDESSWGNLNVLFSTASGNVRRNNLSDFTNIKRNGKIAMKLGEGDELVGVHTCNEDDDVLMATRNGKAIRFAAGAVRVFRGRDSTGVRGIKLLGDDRVVSMSVISDPEAEFILSITENGYGKRTPVSDYRVTGRGGQGVANIEISQRNGKVMASFAVLEQDELMLMTNQGKVIRIRVHGGEGDSIRIASRKTLGVRLFDVADNDDEKVVSASIVPESSDDEGDAVGGDGADATAIEGTPDGTASDNAVEQAAGDDAADEGEA